MRPAPDDGTGARAAEAQPQPRGTLARLFVPEEPRQLPGHRWLKIGLRAAHALATGVLVGGFIFVGAAALETGWFRGALCTGLLLLALDSYESCAFYLQVRGAVVLSKVVLLGLLPWLGPAQGPALVVLVVVSVLSSHAPARLRYFLLIGRGRVQGARSRG